MTSAVSWARVVVPAKTMKIPDLEIGTATAVMPACLVRQTGIWVWSDTVSLAKSFDTQAKEYKARADAHREMAK